MKKKSLLSLVLGTTMLFSCQKELKTTTPTDHPKTSASDEIKTTTGNSTNATQNFSIGLSLPSEIKAARFLTNLELIAFNLKVIKSTMPSFDVVAFGHALETVTSYQDVDDVFLQYNIQHMVAFKQTLKDQALLITQVDQNTNDAIAIQAASFDITPVVGGPTAIPCYQRCRKELIKSSLLCLAGCAGGPVGCWIGVVCEVFAADTYDDCIEGC